MAPRSSSGSGNEKESAGDQSTGRHVVARWLAAGAVALAGCIYFFLASHDQSVCHHETFVAVNLGGHVNTACGPPGIVNLLPFGLIIGLLLWPDLAELGIGGVTLKRRMEAQEERQAGLEASVADVRQTLAQVRPSAGAIA